MATEDLNEALCELADDWRERARMNRNVGQRHDANQIEQCVDDLETLLEDDDGE